MMVPEKASTKVTKIEVVFDEEVTLRNPSLMALHEFICTMANVGNDAFILTTESDER